MIVGRSNLVGKPMAQLLLRENCTVTIAHSRTADLPGMVRQADIVVAAVGRPLMITGDWIKPGAAIIDVGINRVPAPDKGEGKTRTVGDVDFASASAVAGFITPVPGGVGPMTIACLLANTVTTASLDQRADAAPGFDALAEKLPGRIGAAKVGFRRNTTKAVRALATDLAVGLPGEPWGDLTGDGLSWRHRAKRSIWAPALVRRCWGCWNAPACRLSPNSTGWFTTMSAASAGCNRAASATSLNDNDVEDGTAGERLYAEFVAPYENRDSFDRAVARITGRLQTLDLLIGESVKASKTQSASLQQASEDLSGDRLDAELLSDWIGRVEDANRRDA